MRFRVDCTNPETRQHHEFELEGSSLHDVQYRLRERGLVPTSVTPIPETERGRRFFIPGPPVDPKREILKRVVAYTVLVAAVAAGLSATLIDRGAVMPPRLDASVRFDGYQFKIVNTGDSAWQDVRMDINGGLTHRGYTLQLERVAPDQAMVFPAAAFTDPDGNGFNPITEKLVQLRITGTTADGDGALYTRRWD